MQASDEQQIIIKNININNIIVDSVPGSGKTTTNIFIAKAYPDKKILLLTFNRKLSDETKYKLVKENITNMEAYTYHGFCSRKFIENCPTVGNIVINSYNNILNSIFLLFDFFYVINQHFFIFS
jgi:superfamily II DNA or RNA helicase